MDNFDNNPNVNPEAQSTTNGGAPQTDAFGYPVPEHQAPPTPTYTDYAQQQNYGYNNPQQVPYQSGYSPYSSEPDLEKPLSVGQWVGTLLLTCIPCVNLIMLIVWACQAVGNKSRSNWAKAQLIITAIVVAIYVILAIIIAATGASFTLADQFVGF